MAQTDTEKREQKRLSEEFLQTHAEEGDTIRFRGPIDAEILKIESEDKEEGGTEVEVTLKFNQNGGDWSRQNVLVKGEKNRKSA